MGRLLVRERCSERTKRKEIAVVTRSPTKSNVLVVFERVREGGGGSSRGVVMDPYDTSLLMRIKKENKKFDKTINTHHTRKSSPTD